MQTRKKTLTEKSKRRKLKANTIFSNFSACLGCAAPQCFFFSMMFYLKNSISSIEGVDLYGVFRSFLSFKSATSLLATNEITTYVFIFAFLQMIFPYGNEWNFSVSPIFIFPNTVSLVATNEIAMSIWTYVLLTFN